MNEDSQAGWIGVDLDGTLAKHETFAGIDKIGEPIMPMVNRVRRWLMQGLKVKIVTARVASGPASSTPEEVDRARTTIKAWCKEHLGRELEVTAQKDFAMLVLFDDRAVGVEPNTGQLLSPSPI